MKTKHIYYIAALAMLTACTNNEEFENTASNGMQKVTFADPFVGKNLTRASGDISTDGANGTSALTSYKIRVWGQEVDKADDGTLTTTNAKPYTSSKEEAPFYNGYNIEYNTGWAPVSGKEFYYPRDKYTFRFAAFAPVEAIYDATSNTNGVNLAIKPDGSLTFRGAEDNSAGITNIPLVQEINNTDGSKAGWDLLVSNRVLSTPTNGVENRDDINFTFQHILSKLSFYVYASQDANKKFYVKSIKAYLPKDNWTGSYTQNDKTAKPTAESKTDETTNAKTWSATYHDTWAWEKKSSTSTDFTNIDNIVTPSDFDTMSVAAAQDDAASPNSYKEYEVFTKKSTEDKGDQVTLTGYDTTPSEGNTDNITCKSYFLAPTPAAEGEGNVKEYNFYVKIEYTIEETGGNVTTTKDLIGYLDLSKSEFKRFRQGWHHKLYIGLAHKTIRFISATVSDWDGEHNEDMTVSREVEGWTAEQN